MSTPPPATNSDPGRGRRSGAARRIAVAGAAIALVMLLVAGLATADTPEDPGEIEGADTQYPPVPNPDGAGSLGWRQVGGAIFPTVTAQAREMAYTDTGKIPHSVDFYTVSF